MRRRSLSLCAFHPVTFCACTATTALYSTKPRSNGLKSTRNRRCLSVCYVHLSVRCARPRSCCTLCRAHARVPIKTSSAICFRAKSMIHLFALPSRTNVSTRAPSRRTRKKRKQLLQVPELWHRMLRCEHPLSTRLPRCSPGESTRHARLNRRPARELQRSNRKQNGGGMRAEVVPRHARAPLRREGRELRRCRRAEMKARG